MPFSWLFAIIAGSIILFLAIYAASRFIDVAKTERSAEVAKSITILIDPVETGIASAVGDVITLGEDTRIQFSCHIPNGVLAFGRQTLAVSEKSGLKETWAQSGPEISVFNKFIFAEKIIQGEKLYLFSKPIYMGYKVGDITIISSDEYCFVAPPNFIEEELGALSLKNINITNSIESCLEESKKVCFGISSSECDAQVHGNQDYSSGVVIKEGKNIAFVGNLVYAAIFSDADIYECNLQRIIAKTGELAKVYNKKIEIVRVKDCDSIIGLYLDLIIGSAEIYKDSSQLAGIYDIVDRMDAENEKAICGIYSGEDY